MRCGIKDIDVVSKILLEPYINDVCTSKKETRYTHENIKLALENKMVYVIMPNESTVVIFYGVGGLVCEAHIHTLKQSRGKTAEKAALDSMEWIKKNTTFRHIVAYVPSIYMNVVRFCVKMGFITKHVFKSGYLKQDKMCDLFYLCREI